MKRNACKCEHDLEDIIRFNKACPLHGKDHRAVNFINNIDIKDKQRLRNAQKLLGAIMNETVLLFGGVIYHQPVNGMRNDSIIHIDDMPHAIDDVNKWLSKYKVKARIQRLDAGGSPEWGLVDI